MTNSIKSLYHKKHRNLSASEIRETEINLVELEKSLKFIKNCIYSDEYKKIRRPTRLIKYPSIHYYKSIKMVYSFDNKKNYKEYKSKGGKYENFITKRIS